jgi:hypothetical protein
MQGSDGCTPHAQALPHKSCTAQGLSQTLPLPLPMLKLQVIRFPSDNQQQTAAGGDSNVHKDACATQP